MKFESQEGFGPKGHFITNSQARGVAREKAVVYGITQWQDSQYPKKT